MSITKKSIVIILAIMIPLFVIMIIVSDQISMNGFKSIEQNEVKNNLLRGEDAIKSKLDSLQVFAYDWSAWDDTYEFVQNQNEKYIFSNLSNLTLQSSGLNMMMFLDNSAKIVFSKCIDLDSGEEMPVPEDILDHIEKGTLTTVTQQYTGTQGIILLSGRPFLIASNPILTTSGEGPPQGTFIIGYYIDADIVEELSETTHLSIDVQIIDTDDMPEDYKSVWQHLNEPGSVFIQPLDGDNIVGYRSLYDIYDNPIAILKVEMARDVYSQAQTTVSYLHTVLLITGIVFIILFIILLRRIILDRIIILEKTVVNISKTGDRSKRIVLQGKDELSTLADNVNTMLGSLEKADEKIKALYEQEKAHRRELEEEAKARTQFINILAHELRTPLTPILISVEMVKEILSSDKSSLQYKMVSNAFTSAEILRARLEELLDLARFSRGAFKLNIKPIEPSEFLEISASRYKPALEQRRQQLILDIKPCLPKVEIDQSRLEQVVINLLSNAGKYSPENSKITFRVIQEGKNILVEVRDEGIGIPPEELVNLFKPYHRVEKDKENYTGTGLGLAVSSQIIQAHGGKIWAESERGKGSAFKFTIPLEDTGQKNEHIVNCRTFSEMVASAEINNKKTEDSGEEK
jgi:signal transduction histidine kinase